MPSFTMTSFQSARGRHQAVAPVIDNFSLIIRNWRLTAAGRFHSLKSPTLAIMINQALPQINDEQHFG